MVIRVIFNRQNLVLAEFVNKLYDVPFYIHNVLHLFQLLIKLLQLHSRSACRSQIRDGPLYYAFLYSPCTIFSVFLVQDFFAGLAIAQTLPPSATQRE